jgi:hypothetical protein
LVFCASMRRAPPYTLPFSILVPLRRDLMGTWVWRGLEEEVGDLGLDLGFVVEGEGAVEGRPRRSPL